MFRQDELVWFGMFPFCCLIIFWFSICFTLLKRVINGRYRRHYALHAIESLVKLTPTTPINASPTKKMTNPKLKDTPVKPEDSFVRPRHNGSETPGPSPDALREPAFPYPKLPTKVKHVDISTSLRVATRAVIRRAVVVVGGEFARSPRMQYHATSLAQSGLFDEIVLLGLECGNQLSEALRRCDQATPCVFPATDDPDAISQAVRSQLQPYPTPGLAEEAEEGSGGDDDRWKNGQSQQGGGFKPRKWGCFISSHYLISPPQPPEFFQFIFPLRSLHWVACTLYRIIVFTLKYSSALVRTTAIQVNAHGQLVVANVIFVQTPPAIPFVPLIKYIVRPVVMVYNFLLYYCIVVPASWSNPGALKEICAYCSLHTRLRAFWPALVVDWHNYGYTILESAHRGRMACAVYKWLELHICAGDLNVTVSHAMRRSLLSHIPHIPSEAKDSKKKIVDRDKRAVRSPTLKRGMESALENQDHHRPPSSSVEGNVLVLYDVAPSFFAPSNRRIFLEEVLLRTAIPQNFSAPPIRTSLAKCISSSISNTSFFSEKDLGLSGGKEKDTAQKEEVDSVIRDVDKDVWGIAPPPAWVLNSAFLSNGDDDTLLHGCRSDYVIGYPSPTPVGMSLPHPSPEPSIKAHQQRGIIIIASTSWTEDDDYTILIEALQRLDHRMLHACKYIHATAEHHEGSVGTPSRRNAPEVALMEGCSQRYPLNQPENLYGQSESQKQVFERNPVADPNLERASCSFHPFSQIWILITGKGSTRGRFEDAVRAANLSKHITVSTCYFQSYKHYSIALGAADIGLCLHFSSSMLDLPMKGVDMIGCGLPVVALAYPAISELMGQAVVLSETSLAEKRVLTPVSKNGRNLDPVKGTTDMGGLLECERGWIFSSAADLEVLLSFFVGLDKLRNDMPLELKTAMNAVMSNRMFATKTAKLTPLVEMQRRVRAAAAQRPTWEDNWNQTLGNVISEFF
ncbi:unnamed protein product [Phytomonas sp. Hart1]|nr:unnamed protein product [Phytomonas sp. Hart1]|eukprot:CCW69148.1 unnamed protein product [Phytomonas sp. isolate Hart1]